MAWKAVVNILFVYLFPSQLMPGQSNGNATWTDYIGQMETLVKNLEHLMTMQGNESSLLLDWLKELSQIGMDLGVDANKTAFRYVNCSLLVPQLCVVL
jgi:hypothetical protein